MYFKVVVFYPCTDNSTCTSAGNALVKLCFILLTGIFSFYFIPNHMPLDFYFEITLGAQPHPQIMRCKTIRLSIFHQMTLKVASIITAKRPDSNARGNKRTNLSIHSFLYMYPYPQQIGRSHTFLNY